MPARQSCGKHKTKIMMKNNNEYIACDWTCQGFWLYDIQCLSKWVNHNFQCYYYLPKNVVNKVCYIEFI